MKIFTSVKDVENINELIKQAFDLKADPFSSKELGMNKTLGLIFFNSSLRTLLSSQKSAQNLGLNVMVMNIAKDGWQIETEDGVVMDGGKAEHIKEAAAVIGQYCDIIGVRAFPGLMDREQDYREELLNKFIKYAGKPLISLESATRHPLQSLADMMTIHEYKTVARPKVVLSWAPHPRPLPQSVPNSFAEWMLNIDVDFVITHPKGYELAEEFTSGATIMNDQNEAFKDAHFIYAKNWSSYTNYGQILSTDSSWMITSKKMSLTNNAKFMHCLPVRRNIVVSDDVLDSDNSIVIEQANNRVYSAQAVLKQILEDNF